MEDRQNLEAFILKTGTTCKARYMGYKVDESYDDHPTYNWRVQIRRGRKAFSVTYHMWSNYCGQKPTLAEVLNAVIDDAHSAQMSSNLEDFASEFGYGVEYPGERRFAQGVYKNCLKAIDQLEHLYDSKEYEEAMYGPTNETE